MPQGGRVALVEASLFDLAATLTFEVEADRVPESALRAPPAGRMQSMTPPSVPRRIRALAGLWLVTALVIALPALLLRSFAEDASARVASLVLLLSAGLALATALVVGTGTRRVLWVSLGASALVAVAGGSALAVLASSGSMSPAGALLLGGLALVGAALTAIVAGWRLHRDAHASPG